MPPGARTPEELETLLEDSSLLGDQEALSELFEPRAVLHVAFTSQQGHGRVEAARLATEIWNRKHAYVADEREVLQTHDTALVIGGGVISVVHRGGDASWRYAIMMLTASANSPRKQQPPGSQQPDGQGIERQRGITV